MPPSVSNPDAHRSASPDAAVAFSRVSVAGEGVPILHNVTASARRGGCTAKIGTNCSSLLALVVMFSAWTVGILLVTALLIVPAAAARNFARSVDSMFWLGMLTSISAAIADLLVSSQDLARTATGPTIVLCGFAWFLASQVVATLRRRGAR